MESTKQSSNLSTAVNETTTKHNPDFCFPYTSVYFETVGSIFPYVVNAALNVLLAIVAIFANSLVFSAVRHSTTIRLPSKLLLCSLVLTDLGVGLVVQPQFVTFLIAKVYGLPGISCFCLTSYTSASALFTCVSMLTMTAISVDRYIALFFHLQYHEIVKTRRVCVVLAIIWSFAALLESIWYWKAVLHDALAFFVFLVCFLVICVAYIRIYRGLRHQHSHQVQDQAQQQTGNTLDLAKYRRTASSMLWIYGLFILCYVPCFCVYFIADFYPRNVLIYCLLEFSRTLVFLNSCLNPFVYCFRLREIRAKVLQTLREVCGQNTEQ